MIDFFDQIFTAAAKPLRKQFPGIKVTGELSDQAAKFPCVQIQETSNTPDHRYLDSGKRSKYARLQIRVRVFSNKESGRQKEAREILSYLDEIYEPLNLRRKTYVAQSGLYSNSTFRIDATYEAGITAAGELYLV